MIAIEHDGGAIYLRKKEEAAQAGALRLHGLLTPDPLAAEALKEATALVRRK